MCCGCMYFVGEALQHHDRYAVWAYAQRCRVARCPVFCIASPRVQGEQGRACSLWDRYLKKSVKLKHAPSDKFLHGLQGQGFVVYRQMENNRALHEYAKNMNTKWHPADEVCDHFFISLTGQLPDCPVTDSGPLQICTRLSAVSS